MGKHDRVENGLDLDEGAPASNSKIPLPLKVFGILCIVSGAALVPVLALLIVGMVMALQQGAIVEELSAAALVIFVSDAVLMTVLSAMFVILGIRLLRDKRRRTAQIAEVMIVILILVILCDMMLSGLTPDLIPYGVVLVVLVALSSYVDPSLAEERELRRKLRDMETREAAEEGTLGRDETGKGFIALELLQPVLDLRRVLRAGTHDRDGIPLPRRESRALPGSRGFAVRPVLAHLRFRRGADDGCPEPIPRQERRAHLPGERRHRRGVRVSDQLVHAVRLRHRGVGLLGHVPVHRRAHERHVHGHVGRLGRGVDQAASSLDVEAGEPYPVELALRGHHGVRRAHDRRRSHDAAVPRLLVPARGWKTSRDSRGALLRRALRQPVHGEPLPEHVHHAATRPARSRDPLGEREIEGRRGARRARRPPPTPRPSRSGRRARRARPAALSRRRQGKRARFRMRTARPSRTCRVRARRGSPARTRKTW